METERRKAVIVRTWSLRRGGSVLGPWIQDSDGDPRSLRAKQAFLHVTQENMPASFSEEMAGICEWCVRTF